MSVSKLYFSAATPAAVFHIPVTLLLLILTRFEMI